jgi:TatD DNase family protein
MSIIDTHTHLYLEEFDPEPGDAVRRALDAGVHHMIFPNVGVDTIEQMTALHSQFPQVTSMAMGLHPTEIGEGAEDRWECIYENLIKDPGRWVAVGEIGMDLYWDKTFESRQMQLFDTQLSVAESLGLPVIIHCREALDQTLEVMEAHPAVRGVFHSFGGSEADVERIRNRAGDFYFGINGIVTFKNSTLRNILPAITPQRIVLETDAPYLAPVPMRGKRNESAFIVHTAGVVAQALGIKAEALADVTTANACNLFDRLPVQPPKLS